MPKISNKEKRIIMDYLRKQTDDEAEVVILYDKMSQKDRARTAREIKHG